MTIIFKNRDDISRSMLAIIYRGLIKEVKGERPSLEDTEKLSISKMLDEMGKLLDYPISKDRIPYHSSMNTRMACRLAHQYRRYQEK